MAEQAFAAVKQDFFPLVGGLDEETPPIATKPGSIIGSQNYDVAVHGGYRRIDGYERFDGRPRPSDQTYTVLTYTGQSGLEVGDTIVGETSGATATVIDDPAGEHIVALVTGEFQAGESVGGTPDAVDVDPADFARVTASSSAAAANASLISVTVTPTEQRSLLVFMISIWSPFPATMPSVFDGWITDTDGKTWGGLWTSVALLECHTAIFMATNTGNTDNHPVTVTFSVPDRTFNATATLLEFVDDRMLPLIQAASGSWVFDNEDATTDADTGVDPTLTAGAPGWTHSIVFGALATAGDGNGVDGPDTNVNAVDDAAWETLTLHQDNSTGAGAIHSYKFQMTDATYTWNPTADVGTSDWHMMLFPVRISAATPGGVIVTVEEDGADTIDDHLAYRCLAADAARDAIEAVPGYGPVLGVVMYNDVVYAFRGNDEEGGVTMYRHDVANGWTALGPWYFFYFNTGSDGEADEGTPAVGSTITQGSVTATITRIVVTSGSFETDDAAGIIWHTDPSGGGGAFAAGAISLGGEATAVLITHPTWDPTGGAGLFFPSSGADLTWRFDFDIGNIRGGDGQRMLYLVGGPNPPMEFDGTTLAHIHTGMPADQYATHVRIHKQHLFVSYGGSLQHSAIGDPFSWTLLTGAAELSIGDTITGLLSQVSTEGAGGALAVFSRNSTRMLYGSSSSDWQLVQSSPDTGALEWTPQNIGIAMYLDDQGLMLLRPQQEFGNFEHSSVSRKTQKFFEERRGRATCSMVIPSRNQYRLFFDDGTAAAVTLEGRRLLGIAQLSLPALPTCAWASEESSGVERLFIGATNGFVYEMERGTSFDGEDLTASMRLSFHHSRSPYSRKRYRVSIFETKVAMRATLDIQSALSSDEPDPALPSSTTEVIYGGGGYYDVNAYYNQSFFDSAPFSKLRCKTDGTGRNIGFILSNVSRCEPSHTLTGVTIHYSPRRLER